MYNLLFILMAIVLLFLKPYKKEANHKTDIFFFLLTAMAFSTVLLAYQAKTADSHHLTLQLGGSTSIAIVLLYGCIMIGKQVLPKKLLTIVKTCYQHHSSRFRPTEELNETFHYRYEEEHTQLLRK
jgi:phosphatidylserine synthase